jgi:hypothetical protein
MAAYTRDELVDICERAVVPYEKWHDRDSAAAHEQLGRAWVLLKAGCDFRVITRPQIEGSRCVTDDHTIWVEVAWPGFETVDYGGNWEDETFYLPTSTRLDQRDGRDWY